MLGGQMLSALHQPRGESRFIKNVMSEKNFDKYAYFVSRASNFAIVIRPAKKKVVDGEVIFEEGLRLEFNNKMLALEKTEDNAPIIEKLREKLKKEEIMDPKRRSFFEESKPVAMISEDKVIEKLQEKNDKIAALEAENAVLKNVNKRVDPMAPVSAPSQPSDDKQETNIVK